MRYPSVLFVTPYAAGRYFGGVRPPVGIAYVEEFVRAHGVATEAIDMTLGFSQRDLLARVERMRPAMVGFTVMTYQYEVTYGLMRAIKARFPDIRIVAGGPHVSAFDGEVLLQCDAIDYAVSGEGELPLRDLCLGAPLESITGLFWRDGETIRAGAPRQTLRELEILPFPRFESYPLARYTDELEINTSRGCPYGCLFCAVSSIMGQRMRYRSVASVGDEIEYHYARGTRTFQFGDDNFLGKRERVFAIIEEIERRGLNGLTLRCGQGIRADLLDRELLLAMRRAGFRQIGIGVESASDPVLKTIRKGVGVARIETAIALACELGFEVSLFFVIGTPGETLADVDASIALARKYPIMKAFFFNLIPFPGTRLFKWAIENDALLAPWPELFNRADELKLRSRPFFQTPEMPESDRIIAQRRTEAVSKAVQVATLKRKLARFGPVGGLMAQAGRFDWAERLFIGTRLPRRLLDRLMFGSPAATAGGSAR